MQESDETNPSMFEMLPSVRTACTANNNMDEYGLPKLEFSKYCPTLVEQPTLEYPDKPFSAADEVVQQDNGVSWDRWTLGDDSFLSMHTFCAESGAMSPTMVMAETTPPAMHR